jgi:hypothetical protein
VVFDQRVHVRVGQGLLTRGARSVGRVPVGSGLREVEGVGSCPVSRQGIPDAQALGQVQTKFGLGPEDHALIPQPQG